MTLVTKAILFALDYAHIKHQPLTLINLQVEAQELDMAADVAKSLSLLQEYEYITVSPSGEISLTEDGQSLVDTWKEGAGA